MRVISGKYRGRRIETIDSKSLRPTMGIAREAIFNILTHGKFSDGDTKFLEDASVLDLFCGCGALAIEALSRGAKRAVFIDINRKHLDVAKHNVEHIGEEDNSYFIKADSSCPPTARFSCDLVFMDPPYKSDLVNKALQNIKNSGWIHKGSIIVLETGKRDKVDIPQYYEEILERKYGNSIIKLLQVV